MYKCSIIAPIPFTQHIWYQLVTITAQKYCAYTADPPVHVMVSLICRITVEPSCVCGVGPLPICRCACAGVHKYYIRSCTSPACLLVSLRSYIDFVWCTLDALFTVFKTNCCTRVLIMPGRGDVCVYEGQRKLKCLLQKVDMLDKSDKEWALLWWTPL